MNQQRVTVFLLENKNEKYVMLDGRLHRLEKLDDEESVEAICNGGDVLPLISQPTNQPTNQKEV